MLFIYVDPPARWRLSWWRASKRRILIEVDRGNPTVVFPFSLCSQLGVCVEPEPMRLASARRNYPSGKGKQMQYSFDESMSAFNLVRLQWQILRADLIRGGLVARRNCSVD